MPFKDFVYSRNNWFYFIVEIISFENITFLFTIIFEVPAFSFHEIVDSSYWNYYDEAWLYYDCTMIA